MKPHSASSRSSKRVPDLKLSTVHPRAVPSLRLREANAPSHAEKIIEASQDLHNLGVSVLGSNDDATLLAEVRWQGGRDEIGNTHCIGVSCPHFYYFFHEQYDALMGPATRRALSGEDAEGATAGLKAAGAVVRASRRPMQKAVAQDT